MFRSNLAVRRCDPVRNAAWSGNASGSPFVQCDLNGAPKVGQVASARHEPS